MSFFSSIGDAISGVVGDIGGLASSAGSLLGSIPSSIVGSVISGGASLLGGLNQQSAAADQVAQQESFQEQERLSAYPDTVKSLEAAGLNPVLAATQGPLGTPSGAMFNPQNILGGAATSAMQGYQMQAQLENTKSQASLNTSTADKTANDALISGYDADYKGMLAARAFDTQASSAKSVADMQGAQADFIANLYRNHPDLMMSEEILKNIVSPTASSAGSLMHGVGQFSR